VCLRSVPWHYTTAETRRKNPNVVKSPRTAAVEQVILALLACARGHVHTLHAALSQRVASERSHVATMVATRARARAGGAGCARVASSGAP
jgi:hypothetical protein